MAGAISRTYSTGRVALILWESGWARFADAGAQAKLRFEAGIFEVVLEMLDSEATEAEEKVVGRDANIVVAEQTYQQLVRMITDTGFRGELSVPYDALDLALRLPADATLEAPSEQPPL